MGDACVVTDGSEVIAEDSRAQEIRWTSRAPPVSQIVRTVSVEVKQQLKRKVQSRAQEVDGRSGLPLSLSNP